MSANLFPGLNETLRLFHPNKDFRALKTCWLGLENKKSGIEKKIFFEF